MNDFILWIGEFIFGRSHVSEYELIAYLVGLVIAAFVTIHILLKIRIQLFLFTCMLSICILISAAFSIIPFVHELRFSECRNEKSVASINEVEVDVLSTYCRYKKHTLDDEWGDWKLVGIRQKDADN